MLRISKHYHNACYRTLHTIIPMSLSKIPGENTEMASMLILCDDETSLAYGNVTMVRGGGGGAGCE